MNRPDYSLITEAPGLQVTQEQLERIYHRYRFAKPYCHGKDIVEVACGSGIGLGYLASFSKSVSAGDIDEKNIVIAREKNRNNAKVRIQSLDAHNLPFEENSCDVVLFYEALYYLQNPEKFIDESWRILKKGGVMIICSVNKDWKDFHPSPYTYRYFSVQDLISLAGVRFENIKVYGAFKTETGIKAGVFSLFKRIAVSLNLIPGSLRLRAYLKRIFIGKTFPLPGALMEEMTAYIEPVELEANHSNSLYKIIYAVAHK